MRSEGELRRVLEAHGPHVYRFLRAQQLDASTVEDVYQEVFEIFATSDEVFHDERHLGRWLIKVASNRYKQYLGKASTRRERPAPDNDLERAAERRGRVFPVSQTRYFNAEHEVWDYVDALSPEQRECIYLFYVEGFSTKEIAEMTQVRPATIRTRLRRARRLLEKRYRGGHDELR